MEFGPTPLDEAEGATLAHTLRLPDGTVFLKSRRLDASDVERLRALGVRNPVTVRLGPDDIDEDRAAEEIAAHLAGAGVRVEPATTGRCNLVAEQDGVALIPVDTVVRLNLMEEATQLATVPPFSVVRAGGLVATVKVVPFAVPAEHLRPVRELGTAVDVAPFRPLETRIIVTRLPGTSRRARSLARERVEARVRSFGGRLLPPAECEHERGSVQSALREAVDEGAKLVLVFGASATVDRRDVIPRALEATGGTVERLGMPVDPGNLLLLGSLDGVPVVGVPGCARSPSESGFDRVLARLMAEVPVDPMDLADMGVGGLLREPVDRPVPRRHVPAVGPSVAGVVLAAGLSTRTGETNKLLVEVDGEPMVRRVAAVAVASGLAPVVVVTGHDRDSVRRALKDLPVSFVDNPEPARGLSSSLALGIRGLPQEVAGAVVLLGDMPWVTPGVVESLLRDFEPSESRAICVPVFGRRRGNPILWSARYFPRMIDLRGDRGARSLLAEHPAEVWEVVVDEPGILRDVDTVAELERWSQRPSGTEPEAGPGGDRGSGTP